MIYSKSTKWNPICELKIPLVWQYFKQKHNFNSTIVPELNLIMKEVYIKSVANEEIDTYFQKKRLF